MSKNKGRATKLSDVQAGRQTFEALGIRPAEKTEEVVKTPEAPKGPETEGQAYQGLMTITEEAKGEIARVAEVAKGAEQEAEVEAQASGRQALAELQGAESVAQTSIREALGESAMKSESGSHALEGEVRVGDMTREEINDTLDKLQKRRSSLSQPDIKGQAKSVLRAYYKHHPGLNKSRTSEEKALEKDFLDVQEWQKEIEDLNITINELQAKLKSFQVAQSEEIPDTEPAPSLPAEMPDTKKSVAQATEFNDEMRAIREEPANENNLSEASEDIVIERTAYSKPVVATPDTVRRPDTLTSAGEQVVVTHPTLKSTSNKFAETVDVSDRESEADIETVLSSEELSAERDQKDLQYRLKELEKAGSDKWSLAYTGRSLDWSKGQWEKLSREKKVGEDKSEKQQLFDIYNNLLKGEIRVGGLVSDLKRIKKQINKMEKIGRQSSGSLILSMQEQMLEAQSQASNLDLQTLKARESEILLELRKLEELKKQETAKEKVLFNQTNDLIHVSGTSELTESASAEKITTIPVAPYYVNEGAVDSPIAPDSTGTIHMENADAVIMASALGAEVARASSYHEVAPTLIENLDMISKAPDERESLNGAKKLEEETVVGKRPGRIRRLAGYAGYGLAGAALTGLVYGARGVFKVFQWVSWKAPMNLFKILMEASADWGGYFKKKWQGLQNFADKPVGTKNKERQ